MLSGAEPFSNFHRESSKRHFYEFFFEIGPVLKSDHWIRRRGHLKVVFCSIFSFGGHFVQRSGTIVAILIVSYPRNIPMKLFQNTLSGL